MVIVLFFLLAYRGIAIALRARDATGALLAAGITAWLVFQAWVNMAVVASLVPMTGITLPFISYAVFCLKKKMIAVGILLSIGRARSATRATVPRPSGRRRDGRTHQSAPRGRRVDERGRSGGRLSLPRWSSRPRS